MTDPILNGKRILVVDDEPDVLELVEEDLHNACLNLTIDKKPADDGAVESLKSSSYDLVILDIMGVRGFDLLKIAVKSGF